MPRKSESITHLAQALKSFHSLCPAIKKTKKVDTGRFSYWYAPLPDILDSIQRPLDDCGLVVTQLDVNDGDRVGVYTCLMHTETGEWIEGEFCTPIVGESCQDIGQMLTYYRRYGLEAVLGIASEDDNDANEAKTRRSRPSSRVPVPDEEPSPDEIADQESHYNWAKTKAKFSAHCKNDEAETIRLFKECASFENSQGKVIEPKGFDVSPKWQHAAIGKLEKHIKKCKDPRHFVPQTEPVPEDVPF